MKIGFSFGRCVRSIVLGEVKVDDVLVIIARTRMKTKEDVAWVVDEYLHTHYLFGLDAKHCHEVGLELFQRGKILEPRANGIHPTSVPRGYIWMDLFPTAIGSENESVKAAWEHYRMLLELAEQVAEPGFVPEHSEREKPMTDAELEEYRKAVEMLANSI